jgi:hypothetical protein
VQGEGQQKPKKTHEGKRTPEKNNLEKTTARHNIKWMIKYDPSHKIL